MIVLVNEKDHKVMVAYRGTGPNYVRDIGWSDVGIAANGTPVFNTQGAKNNFELAASKYEGYGMCELLSNRFIS